MKFTHTSALCSTYNKKTNIFLIHTHSIGDNTGDIRDFLRKFAVKRFTG